MAASPMRAALSSSSSHIISSHDTGANSFQREIVDHPITNARHRAQKSSTLVSYVYPGNRRATGEGDRGRPHHKNLAAVREYQTGNRSPSPRANRIGARLGGAAKKSEF